MTPMQIWWKNYVSPPMPMIKPSKKLLSDYLMLKTKINQLQTMKARPAGHRDQLRPSRHQNQFRPSRQQISFSSDQIKSELKSDTVQFKTIKTNISVASNQDSQCILAVSRSSVQIDNSLRERINSLLKQEILYKDILNEMESTERNEIIRGKEKYKLQKRLLMIHVTGQPEDVQYWRTVVPDDVDVKTLLVRELHSVPYSAHPGVQRTLGKVRRHFWWKGMAGDVREFVESCPTCQLEKADHTLKKGSL